MAWERCDQLESIHAFLAANVTVAVKTDELLRSEWVARVSALDLYCHESVAQLMLLAFQGRIERTERFSKFKIGTETMMNLLDAKTQDERDRLFDLEVRSQLERLTFQFPEDIADGFRLCLALELWNEIAVILGASPSDKSKEAKSLKRDLSLVVQRRNKIAHEGDLKPGLPRVEWPISRADLERVKQSIEQIVCSIDKITGPFFK